MRHIMSLPRAPQAVIFDVDGLLFDTEALYQQAYLETAKLGGYDVSADVIRLVIGIPWLRGRGLLLQRLGEEFPIFFGAMRLSRAAWPHLEERRGAIVNIVGVGGRTGSAEFTIGGSVNAALLNLTKSLADRGIRDGIRVNAINPGAILTERLRGRVRSFAAEQGIEEAAALDRMARSLGVARFGEPDEIARAVAFLASPLAGYCQGSIVDVDGGQTRTL